MCFGGGPSDNSAQIAKQQEDRRLERIQAGTEKVNNTFAGFDDNYYTGLGKSYLDFYKPQLDRQHTEAQKQLTYNFANAGSLDSGAAHQKIADLDKEYATQNAQLSDRAINQAQSGRASVEQNRADLIQQLEAGAGIDSTAQTALARANSLTTPPVYSPLADTFASFTNSLGNSSALQSRGYAGLPFTSQPTPLLSSGGNSSVKSVG